jgi:phage shock protein E
MLGDRLMNWIAILVLVAVVLALILMKQRGQISATAAAEHLKQGALVIDVRTQGEFSAGHLDKAINIPLDQIGVVIPQRVKDKSQVLLLHCASGMRSGVAQKKLQAMGYANAFNLGSYGRAESIVKQQG